MSSLLRLPSLDRPSLGLTKRFSFLSTHTAYSTQDDLNSSLVSLQTLPSVARMDSDDFLNMFESPTAEATTSHQSTIDPFLPELSSTPVTIRFPELHGSPQQRFELAPITVNTNMPRRKPVQSSSSDAAEEIGYRSSVSSSVPSTKLSNASSRISRRTSVSSVTEDTSASERSAKDPDKENALHERLRRRSQGKRVSFGNESDMKLKAKSETHLPLTQTLHNVPVLPSTPSQRPISRGERLGRAMANKSIVTPPATPKTASPTTSRDQRPTSNTSAPRKSSLGAGRQQRKSKVYSRCVDDVDRIRVGIMSHLDCINDLQSCALVSRDFYMTFQKYETTLVDSVLYNQSPAAWELRHSVRHLEKPSPFRLRSVLRDFATVQALEDFIVWRCQTILRPQSMDAFLGNSERRKAELEDAIWLIWLFCNTFGKTSSSDGSFSRQTQWLNGKNIKSSKSQGTTTTARHICTMKELEDMSELWRCFETLLSGFKGREAEARQAGLFDNSEGAEASERELLNAWIHDVLSLGPKAVLTLSSCDFEQARVLGITRWTPPKKEKSRAGFLKAAVEDVYRERLMKEARQKALDYRKSIQHSHKRSSSDPAHAFGSKSLPSPSTQDHRQSLRLRTNTENRQSMPLQNIASISEQLEIRPDCDPLSPVFAAPVMSPSSNPTVFSPLSMTKNASTRLGPTLFPMQNRDQSQRLSIPSSLALSSPTHNDEGDHVDVVDPTDKAVTLMVKDMGFSEIDAKRALARSDTGSGIDIERAIELLASGRSSPPTNPKTILCELPTAVNEVRMTRRSSRQEVCEGNCKPMLLVEPRRERVSGLGMVKRGLSYRMSFRKSMRLASIPDDDEYVQNSPARSTGSNGHIATARDPTLSHPTSSAMNARAAPLLTTTLNIIDTDAGKTGLSTVLERSPVSPVTPTWPRTGSDSITEAGAGLEGSIPYDALPHKPRITLQRVGTGVRKSGWALPGRKRKQIITQPEIIGYAY